MSMTSGFSSATLCAALNVNRRGFVRPSITNTNHARLVLFSRPVDGADVAATGWLRCRHEDIGRCRNRVRRGAKKPGRLCAPRPAPLLHRYAFDLHVVHLHTNIR